MGHPVWIYPQVLLLYDELSGMSPEDVVNTARQRKLRGRKNILRCFSVNRTLTMRCNITHPEGTFVSLASLPIVAIPFALMVLIGISLRLVSRLLMLSSRHRSKYLFSETAWLPLDRYTVREDGDEVRLTTTDGLRLTGSFFRHTTARRRGVVLFCHELNGSRYGVNAYIDSIRQAGFDLLTFDFRGHGESQSPRNAHPTPRVTWDNLEDVRTAIDWIVRRFGSDCKISLFGMGKGATIALCAAGKDARISSIILDGASPDGRLFKKTCWGALIRSSRSLVQTGSPRFLVLVASAVLATLIAPFQQISAAWHRFILGFWCNCRFVNTWSLVRRVQQPILIVHGNVDSKIRADQIHAFRQRMRRKPEVWFVPKPVKRSQPLIAREACCRRVVEFLENHQTSHR